MSEEGKAKRRRTRTAGAVAAKATEERFVCNRLRGECHPAEVASAGSYESLAECTRHCPPLPAALRRSVAHAAGTNVLGLTERRTLAELKQPSAALYQQRQAATAAEVWQERAEDAVRAAQAGDLGRLDAALAWLASMPSWLYRRQAPWRRSAWWRRFWTRLFAAALGRPHNDAVLARLFFGARDMLGEEGGVGGVSALDARKLAAYALQTHSATLLMLLADELALDYDRGEMSYAEWWGPVLDDIDEMLRGRPKDRDFAALARELVLNSLPAEDTEETPAEEQQARHTAGEQDDTDEQVPSGR